MKRFAFLAAVALSVPALYAVSAPAGQQGVSPKRVARLEKRVGKLESQLKCLKTYVPLTVYGQEPTSTAPATYGYSYTNESKKTLLTTAVDVTDQGDTPDFNAVAVSKSCVGSVLKTAHLRPATGASGTNR